MRKYLPEFAWITEGKVADVKVARQLHFVPGIIVIDDRGYTDYVLWGDGVLNRSILAPG
jgi:hypothetical protein